MHPRPAVSLTDLRQVGDAACLLPRSDIAIRDLASTVADHLGLQHLVPEVLHVTIARRCSALIRSELEQMLRPLLPLENSLERVQVLEVTSESQLRVIQEFELAHA